MGKILPPERIVERQQAELETMRNVIDQLDGEVMDLRAERDRFREHSIILNHVSWCMAELLDLVPDGATEVQGDALKQVEQVATELETLRGIAKRVADGWRVSERHWSRIINASDNERSLQWDAMTEAEVYAIYGQKESDG